MAPLSLIRVNRQVHLPGRFSLGSPNPAISPSASKGPRSGRESNETPRPMEGAMLALRAQLKVAGHVLHQADASPSLG